MDTKANRENSMFNMLTTLAQQGGQGGGVGGAIFLVLMLAIAVLVIVGLWKVFEKAGQPGWAAIIPIYNIYILLKIVGRPWWWIILFIIPIVSLIITIIVYIDVAKSFGKSVLFGIGLIFLAPIFICILGFGDSKYIGPAAAK
jgi:hypothetical protein